jgi:hypothetical protein
MMKRDIDLARRLLLDIENRGADCSVGVLRSEPNHETEERIRYHLRLLIDAGLLKEVDRTSSGVPCVRLTYEGHELLELTRSEARWREAKWTCQERTGGQSLIAIRALLLRWAVAGPVNEFPPVAYGRRRSYLPMASHYPHHHRPLVYRRDSYRFEPYRFESYRHEPSRYESYGYEPYRYEATRHEPYRYEPYRYEPYRYEPFRYEPRSEGWIEDDGHYVRVRPETARRWQANGSPIASEPISPVETDCVLPDYLI